MTSLQLFLLGSPQITIDGRSLNIGRRKDLALLVYLAITAEQHSRDKLATLLWPEIDESRGRAALRKSIHRLKQQVGDWLDVSAEVIRLQPGFELDTELFQQHLSHDRAAASIQAAAELYRDDFLAGFTLPDAPDFDRWHYFQAEKLRQELMQALVWLVEHFIHQGQYEAGIAASRQLLALDPLHEAAHRLLMKCLIWAGQRGAALRQYQECLRLLDEELGVAPEPETTALYEQIRDQQLPAPAAHQQSMPTIVPSFIDLRGVNRLAGRQFERSEIKRMINAAAVSHGRLLLVEGEPGIGKSRLLEEAVLIAQQENLHTLWLNCYQVEQDIPYQPAAEMIDQALLSWPEGTFQALPLAVAADLATLVPELANLVPGLPDTPRGVDESKRARLSRSLIQLIEGLASPNGLLLIFDDIHWADHATLQFLYYLARHLTGQAVLLIASFRGSAASGNPELATILNELGRQELGQRIQLESLSTAEVQELVQRTAPAAGPELSQWLFRETQGNPLFLNSILQSLPKEILTGAVGIEAQQATVGLPESLVNAIRDRLRWLPAEQGHVLELAAVIGRRFRFDLLQALTETRTLTLLETVDSLVQRQLLREDRDGRYDFAHPKIREVLYQDLNAVRRQLLHRKVAETIEKRASFRSRELAGVLAAHFEQAGQWDKAVQYLSISAEEASQLFALQEAITAYNRALELAGAHPHSIGNRERLKLRQGRGKAQALLVNFNEAIEDLQLALELARRLELAEAEQETLLQLGMIHRRSDNYRQAVTHLNEALVTAEAAGDERAMADTLFHLGTVFWSQGDNQRATDYHERAVSIVQRLSLEDRVAMQAYHGRAEAYYLEGNQPQAEHYLQRSLELSRQLGDKAYEAENLLMLAVANTAFMGGTDYALALRYGEQARAICEEYHLDWHLMPVLTTLGLTVAATGGYEAGLNLSQEGIRLAEETGNRRYLAVALTYHGYLLLDLNLWTRAIDHLEEAVAVARSVRSGHPLLRSRAHLALARLRSGDESAGEALADILQEAQRNRRGIVAAHCLAGLAEWAIQIADAAKASEYAAQLMALGRAGSMREMMVRAVLWDGEAKRLAGEFAAAEKLLLQAADETAEIGRVRLEWDVHAALARLYKEQGQNEARQRHEAEGRRIISLIAAGLHDPELRAGLSSFR